MWVCYVENKYNEDIFCGCDMTIGVKLCFHCYDKPNILFGNETA